MQYCLARKILPFLEVLVRSATELADTSEVITDIDVLGVEFVYEGDLRRLLFDCKTATKLSPVNRAFWARGLCDYTGCDEAIVLLKTAAVHNHRISALKFGVDLHDVNSFKNLGTTFDPEFSKLVHYQSSLDRWFSAQDSYTSWDWALELLDLSSNVTPVTEVPWTVFRKFIAVLRDIRGQFDPSKPAHVSLFLYAMSSMFVLWSTMGRDIRRFYDPALDKTKFERVLRYYIWGGRESFEIRKQLHERSTRDQVGATALELPAWDRLVDFVGLLIASPKDIFNCSYVCREFAMRTVTGADELLDRNISKSLDANRRVRQFVLSLSDYLGAAANLPKDLVKEVERTFMTF